IVGCVTFCTYVYGLPATRWSLPVTAMVSGLAIGNESGTAPGHSGICARPGAGPATPATARPRGTTPQRRMSSPISERYGIPELLTKASRFPFGDHDGTLIVPCPP